MPTSIPKHCTPSEQLREYVYSIGINVPMVSIVQRSYTRSVGISLRLAYFFQCGNISKKNQSL